ncbi:MAG: hypothetical protein SNJ74_11235, partial [Fimbriimonadaceae bacterium]
MRRERSFLPQPELRRHPGCWTDGIFRSPSFPVAPVNNPTNWEQAQTGGFSYGVHHTIFADN